MPQQKLPFELGTRRRFKTIGQYPITPGDPLPTIFIPKVGLVGRIFLKLEGTITQSADTPVLSPKGYAALFPRIVVEANLGSGSIVNASAWGIEKANYWYAPNIGPVQNTYAGAAAANRVDYGLIIPINANDRTLLTLGLLMLQAEQIQLTLNVQTASLATFITSSGGDLSSDLTLYVAYEYWDVPNPMEYELPPATICRLEEEKFPITTAGDQVYTMPLLGNLAQLTEMFLVNGDIAELTGATPDVTNFRILANKTDTWLDYPTRFAEMQEQEHYNTPAGSFLTPGCRTWDFFASSLQTFNFGDRDLVDTERITTLEFIATVRSNFVADADESSRYIVRRVFQRLT